MNSVRDHTEDSLAGGRLEVRRSKLWPTIQLLLALGLLGLVWFGISIGEGRRLTEEGMMICAGMLALAGLLLYWGLTGFRSKPLLVIDQHGLDYVWYGPIRWDQIRGIALQEIPVSSSTQRLLYLSVARPGRYTENGRWWQRMLLTQTRREAAVGDLAISLNMLDTPAAVIVNAAMALRSRVSPPLIRNWYPGMPEAHINLQRATEANLARKVEIENAAREGALDPAQARIEMQQVLADLERQGTVWEARTRKARESAKMDNYLSYAVTIGVVVYGLFRIFR